MKLDQEPEVRKELVGYRQTCALEQYFAAAIPDTFPIEKQDIESVLWESYRQIHLFLLKLARSPAGRQRARLSGKCPHLSDIAAKFPSEMYRFAGG